MCKSCSSMQIMRDITLISRKIYTVGTNFTRPPVVTVATNLNSGHWWHPHSHHYEKTNSLEKAASVTMSLFLNAAFPMRDIFPRPEHRLVFFPVANYCLGLGAIQRLDYSIPIGNCHRHFHPLDIFSSSKIDQIAIRK